MTRRRRHSSLADLVRAVAAAAKRSHTKVAVGGGVAVRAYGYCRETTDVDVFVSESARHAFFTALRSAGFDIAAVAPPAHYIAQKRGDPAGVWIDLLIPFGDPELSSIRSAVPRSVDGATIHVMPIKHLIANKVITFTGRGERKDFADIQNLYNMGLFDQTEVRGFMLSLPEDYVKEYDAIMAEILKRKGGTK